MIWIVLTLVALAVLAPLLLVLRGRGTMRGARELALDLHRSQLQELDRDLAEKRILPEEHKTAVLEVQRRLLSAGAMEEAPARSGQRWPVILTAVLVPIAGAGLYWASGAKPTLTSGENGAFVRQAQEEALVDMLHQRLLEMDPATDRAREGYKLLGKAEMSLGHKAEAAEAFKMALTGKFDPVTAVLAAEASTEAEGRVSEDSAALFQRALDTEPNAPWRDAVKKRIAENKAPPAQPPR